MPNSYTFYKPEIREYFKHHVPTHKKILDVGPGQGTYAKLLGELGYDMDALEVWAPYIEEFELWNYYGVIHNGDIREFDYSEYDYIILGDILEHLTAEEGQKLITDITNSGKECLVAVPYMMAQDGEEYGNIYETHLQEDLTHQMMNTRYPQLIELYSNDFYGYYTNKHIKAEKAYVLYANASYVPTVKACVASIQTFSELPIYVYLLNTDAHIPGAQVINWQCNVPAIESINNYIDRSDKDVYRLLIERPRIVKDALLKYAHTVAYIDSDSVATEYIDSIFDMYPKMNYPYFVEGIYDYLHINGRGGADTREDMSTTLEAPACELFGVNQYIRQRYRQTGYFVANHYCFDFLDEWYWMCMHPKVLANHEWYAPYHEETLANVLLWKWKVLDGLPYIYTNASLDKIDKIYNDLEWGQHHGSWSRLPDSKHKLLFLHGEKDPTVMLSMIDTLVHTENKLNVLFLAPHLSTGGMPAFLLKRVQELQKFVRIYVVEYSNFSPVYTVQKDQIKDLLPKHRFFTLGENKMELIDIIKKNNIDIVHVEEMLEGFESFNQVSPQLLDALYAPDRTWGIVETCHNVWFNPDNLKKYEPEAYAFCTTFHNKTFANMQAYKKVVQFPIEDKRPSIVSKITAKNKVGFAPFRTSVVNVGLWTPGKNQKEGIEIAKKYPHMDFHFIGNQAPNFKEYWEPLMEFLPKNVYVWGEKHNVEDYLKAADIFMFNSTWECNPLVLREAISYALPVVARNLPQYEDMFTKYLLPIDSDLDAIHDEYKNGIVHYDIPDITFVQDHIDLYNHTLTIPIVPRKKKKTKVDISLLFVEQPKLEITGSSDSQFLVKFFDEEGVCHYENTIGCNSWVKLNRQWFTKWTAKVWEDGELIFEETLNYEGKRVYISIDSASLGDTIAWIPYCDEFRKKHNCHVVVSTYKNFLFKEAYPELEFVVPGTVVNNIHGQYIVGWRYSPDKEPVLCNTIPLQQAASNILGLEWKEIKPTLAYTPVKFNDKDTFVTIATNSTAGCKFWTKEGWQEVINYLVDQGYKVYNVSKERNPFDNCIQIEDTTIDNTVNMIANSKFFIGLSSGLSWLAWAIGTPVVMISNFTETDHEFQSNCIRITDTSLCHGCWNNPNFKFDKGDWDWCPINKNTPNHFECHRSIKAKKVIASLQPLIVL
jgi:autotransporter strand-loop-strand O-heptosyltransferase